jgi:hypothetical protein
MLKLSAAVAALALLFALSAPSYAADVNTSGTTASPSGGSSSSGVTGDLGQSYSNTAPGQQKGGAGSASGGPMSSDQSAQVPQPNGPTNSDLSNQSNGGLTGKSNDAGTPGSNPSR